MLLSKGRVLEKDGSVNASNKIGKNYQSESSWSTQEFEWAKRQTLIEAKVDAPPSFF